MKDINSGMTLAEIMQMGEDPCLYGSLTDETIHQTSETTNKINDLLTQISILDPIDDAVQIENLVDQITTLTAEEKTALETRIDTDLNAQETLKAANEANDTIAVNVPFNAPSKLFDLVASPLLRKLADKIIARRLDQDAY
jgi:hypothetical protein